MALFHRIVDSMVDSYRPEVEKLEDRLDELEKAIFEAPDPKLVRRILDEKREVAEREIAVAAGVHIHWLTLAGLDRTIPDRGIAVLDDAQDMLAIAKADSRVKVFRPITRKIRQTKTIT